jgi:hypothetical protein
VYAYARGVDVDYDEARALQAYIHKYIHTPSIPMYMHIYVYLPPCRLERVHVSCVEHVPRAAHVHHPGSRGWGLAQHSSIYSTGAWSASYTHIRLGTHPHIHLDMHVYARRLLTLAPAPNSLMIRDVVRKCDLFSSQLQSTPHYYAHNKTYIHTYIHTYIYRCEYRRNN